MYLIDLLSGVLKQEIAFTHCDIPCGIYDPFRLQQAAHTIIRMTEFLASVKREDETKAEHDIARCVFVKEEHSDILEEELHTLKDDYFKEEHLKEYPNLIQLFEKAFKTSTKARQSMDIKAAEETLKAVLQIAEIFFKSKGLKPIRIKSPYPTQREIVVCK